jgi:hypothetical protein
MHAHISGAGSPRLQHSVEQILSIPAIPSSVWILGQGGMVEGREGSVFLSKLSWGMTVVSWGREQDGEYLMNGTFCGRWELCNRILILHLHSLSSVVFRFAPL